MKDVKVALEEERSNLAAVKSEGEKAALNFKILSGNERAGFRVATEAEIQPAGDRLGNGTWRGSIGGEFNGYRLPFLRKLSVRVIEARGMPKMDTFGSGDPYAICRCRKEHFTTSIVYDSKRCAELKIAHA